MKYRIGLDVGSTTAKMVVVDAGGNMVWWRYERHNARVRELLRHYFTEVGRIVGDAEVDICVTGSVGMQTAEMLQVPFVQEVVAASVYTRQRHPEARLLIDIGGEDSKVILLNGGRTDLRMNGNCAGGTGAFIDQMAVLLGLTHQQMNDLAGQSNHSYAIASRCGVFAKTDAQNLVSRNVPLADICASIFHSIAVQTITTLAHGSQLEPPVLLCGGPLTFLPALRRAFAVYMQMDEQQFIVTEKSNLIPAMGCALQADGTTAKSTELIQRLDSRQEVKVSDSIPPLFADEHEYAAWRDSKVQSSKFKVQSLRKGTEMVVIGIDSGSTTTKIVAARPDGTILFCHYAPSLGQPVKAVSEGLERLKAEADRQQTQLQIVGTCSTGYGEELIKAAFCLDNGIVETTAHARAASRLMPDVTFILDIGGQDMKAIFVDKGVITRMELNEACSSGCGTFLQTFAESLGYEIGDFARMACTARHPSDLGSRCTVFMNSKVKQVLREGADVADIAAGLSYSVVNNCLYKVLKLKDNKELGGHVVLQGGTMRNDAVVRAFERLTGCEVVRSNMPEMMGAYGCALYAAEHQTRPRNVDEMRAGADFETRNSQCGGCENHCRITRYKFAGGGNYVSGNKCERIFTNSGSQSQKGLNIYPDKYHLLFDRETISAPRKIGIPRILNMYENYPFWHRLLTDCGFQVVLSSDSVMSRYEQALCTVMSDNICFPAKLVHSHVEQLAAMGVERILMPYVVYEQQDCSSAVNSFNCPIVSGFSDVIRSAMSPAVPVDSPVLDFSRQRPLKRQVMDYLHSLDIAKSVASEAFKQAWMAQKEYESAIKHRAREILTYGKRHHQLTILLAGRPYHADPLVQHRISETIAAMGVNVISEDVVRNMPDVPDGETNTVRQWAYVNRIIKAAQWVGKFAPDVQFVQLTSFGCGPDAFIQDEVRSLLARHGKPYTLLKIDDVSNVGSLKLRVRSLIESLRAQQNSSLSTLHSSLFKTTRTFRRQDRQRTILVPHISEFVTPLLPALGQVAGYRLEVLPPSDAESARVGLQYANNEVCYPATLIVGDVIRALQSGRYDLSNIAVAMSQTGGQCRATNYAGLIKRAMVQAGFSDVPLITLGVTTNADGANEQEGFDVSWRKMGPIVLTALLYADTISKMYYAAAARCTQPGMAEALREKFLRLAANSIRQKNTDELLWYVSNAASEFNMITSDVSVSRVGIVGEIFLKFNHFAHQEITSQLMAHGMEVVPPLITPFFLQEFVNVVRNREMGLPAPSVPTAVVKMLYSLARRRTEKFNRAASRFRYFRPFGDIREEARLADGIVSPAAQAGEGWLLPAEICTLAESGVKNVISLQPFGCIANHVVSKGIERALLRRYPDLNLLSLDFDSGISRVNVTNRLLLFINRARRPSSAAKGSTTNGITDNNYKTVNV